MLFWKLMVFSLIMLVFGFVGELQLMDTWVAFGIGMAAWLYILYEIFAGEASKVSSGSGSAASQKAYNALKWIVSVGWVIYPVGYVLGQGQGGEASLNLVYNLADLVNKIAFGAIIWSAAVSDSEA
jgi:bacteriorhodopsin